MSRCRCQRVCLEDQVQGRRRKGSSAGGCLSPQDISVEFHFDGAYAGGNTVSTDLVSESLYVDIVPVR